MPRNPLTNHGYQCPYCELKCDTLKGVRMHGGYSHKNDIRKVLRYLISERPGTSTNKLAHTLNIERAAVTKYLNHMSDIQKGKMTKQGQTWYKKDAAPVAPPKSLTHSVAAAANEPSGLDKMIEEKVREAVKTAVVQPKPRRPVPLSRWGHFKAVFTGSK